MEKLMEIMWITVSGVLAIMLVGVLMCIPAMYRREARKAANEG